MMGGMDAEYMTGRVWMPGTYRAADLMLAGAMPARPLNVAPLLAR